MQGENMRYTLFLCLGIALVLTGCSEKNHSGQVDAARQYPTGLDPTNYAESKLCEASENGDIEAVKTLLENGVDINEKGKFDAPALWFASLRDHAEIAKLLLDNGAYVDAKDSQWGATPFKAAAEMGHLEIARMLLAKGAYPYTKDKNGTTALMSASLHGHTDLVRLLLDIGADINAKDRADKTALHYASQKGQTEVIEILLKKGADFETESGDENGLKPTDSPGPGVYKAGVSSSDSSPMMWAAYEGKAESVRVLIEKGADVNMKDGLYHTALHIAAMKGHAEVVKVLVEKGVLVNATDIRHRTALHYASEGGYINIVKFLLNNGANVKIRDLTGKTPIWGAWTKGHEEIEKLLKEAK
jgi:ankyrin repeat protein